MTRWDIGSVKLELTFISRSAIRRDEDGDWNCQGMSVSDVNYSYLSRGGGYCDTGGWKKEVKLSSLVL